MNLINIDEPNKKSFTSKCLGIDFGTTNSVCSIKIGEKVIFIEDSKKMNLIPSIVCFDKTVKVGNDIDLEKNLQTSIFPLKGILQTTLMVKLLLIQKVIVYPL